MSSQDDDEYHFTAPWAYPGDRATAMRRLVAVATGAEAGRSAGEASPGADAGASIDVYGRDKREVAESSWARRVRSSGAAAATRSAEAAHTRRAVARRRRDGGWSSR